MKTLKKILSVVLVVAMLASMCIVGAAAAETEKTNYEEAVAVVTGVGIIEGDENGMNYQGNVTREQAAKIIAYLLLGEKTAEDLKVSTAPFADVAANRWSAGYIAYLKGQGIISGVSDTEFDPTANVTGVAFAKMLLSAVGYGADGEFEGKDWDINTITFANDNGVFTGTLTTDLTAPATREEAMLYAFNVLTGVPTVKYNKTFESYYVGPSALQSNTQPVDPTDLDTDTSSYAYTLGWTKYMLKQVNGEYADNFGRPAATWTTYGQVIADSVAAMDPTAVLTGSVYSKDIYTALGKTVVKNLNENMIFVEKGADDPATEAVDSAAAAYTYHPYINVYVDGVAKACVWGDETPNDRFDDKYDYVGEWTTIAAGEYLNQVSNAGAHVELYLTADLAGDYYLDIVVWYEHIGDITKVDATNDKITIDGKYAFEGAEGFAKKDVVIYTIGNDGTNPVVGSVEHVAPVVGTYTGKDWMNMYLVDGVGKSISHVNDKVALEVGYAYEFYYDSLGTILRADGYDMAGATGAYQYLYVVGAEAQGYDGKVLDGKDAKVALTVAYADGGAEVVYYAVKYDSKTDEYYITVDGADYVISKGSVANANVAQINNGAVITSIDKDDQGAYYTNTLQGWFSYTKNDDGEITLKNLNNKYANINASAVSTITSQATIGGVAAGYTANSQTVLKVVDAKGNVTVYTGIANFPAKTLANGAGAAIYTYGYQSKVIKTMTVFDETGKLGSSNIVGYCQFLWSEDINGYTYMFNVDGTTTFVTLDKSLGTNTGMAYDMIYENGVYDVKGLTGAYNPTTNKDDVGLTNMGGMNLGGFYANGYGSFNMVTYSYDYWECATIDTIDEGFFTTVGVDAADVADSVQKFALDSATYYFDGNTKIIDVSGAITPATEISEGDVFLAYINEDASATYRGAAYCEIIWIIA